MNTNYISKLISRILFAGIFLLALFGISASNATAAKITVKKDVCNSSGSNNTCNGQNNELDGDTVDFSVTPGANGTSGSIITVPINNGSGQMTVDGFAANTTFTVCEVDLDPRFDAVPQPDSSTGGNSQTANGDCITFTGSNGNGANTVVQFINVRVAFLPTAARVMIAGRVTVDSGFVRGIGKVSVTMLNTRTGESQTALTNRLGYYEFNDLTVGDTYIITVLGNGYSFTPQVVTLSDDTALDMYGSATENTNSKGRKRAF